MRALNFHHSAGRGIRFQGSMRRKAGGKASNPPSAEPARSPRKANGKPAKPLTSTQRRAEMDATFCIVRFGGKTRIFTWEKSPVHPGAFVPAFYSKYELATSFEHEFITEMDTRGNSRRTPLFNHWLRQPSTPRAVGLTLDPAGGRIVDEQANLWRGFGKQPVAGSWPLLRAHIETVICNDHAPSIDYLIKWLAWTLQNPGEPSEVAVVLRGLKGTGKGLLARVMLDIFASNGLHISNREHLTGRFNSHLMHTCFIFLDEAIWPGDKAGEGTLKRIVTERTLTIEAKGIDAGEAINRLSIMMSSNEDWVCPASADERRFVVFNVSDAHRTDRVYFAALVDEIASGGTEAFFADMRTLNLEGWHPRNDVPQTEGLAMQKRESAKSELEWLWMLLNEGTLPDTLYLDCEHQRIKLGANVARTSLLWEHCVRSSRSLKFNFPVSKFGNFLAGYGVQNVRRQRGMFLHFPPLSEMRATFLAQNPWMPAFDPGGEEWFQEGEIE